MLLETAFYPEQKESDWFSITEISCCAAEAETATSGGAAASSPGDDQRTRHATQAQDPEHAQTRRQSTCRRHAVILHRYEYGLERQSFRQTIVELLVLLVDPINAV